MARIRSIKPEFWKSEAIASMPLRTRLTFIGLWTYVDDNGVGLDNFKLVAAELYPLEEDPRDTLASVREDLARLADEGRIYRYTVGGKAYLEIVNWDEHQKIDRPAKPRYPASCHPDAVVLGCENTDPRETVAKVSRECRETPSTGSGIRDQGTGDQGTGNALARPARQKPDLTLFPEFWNTYPSKKARGAAEKAWLKAITKADPAQIIAAAASYRDDPQRNPQYTAHPATWLNQERWTDERTPEGTPLVARSRASPGMTTRHGVDLLERNAQAVDIVEYFRDLENPDRHDHQPLAIEGGTA